MKERIEILITINNFCISDLHETIASLLHQSNLSIFDVTIFFDNQTNLPIESEKKIIKKNNCKISEKAPLKKAFFLHLNTGAVVSQSFLYKGIYYLKYNRASFVHPEYTFTKIYGTTTFLSKNNTSSLTNIEDNCLVNYHNIHNTDQIHAQTIKDTCIVLPTIKTTPKQYFKKLKTTPLIFNSKIFHPSIVNNNKASHTTDQPKTKTSFPSIIYFLSSYISLPSKAHKKCSFPTIFLSDPLKNELSNLSEHKLSLKGFEHASFLDLFTQYNQLAENRFLDYTSICKNLHHHNYDYIMVLPWLIPGGIDLFAINYIKTISELNPSYNILVVLTENNCQSLNEEQLNFSQNTDVINLPNLIQYSKNYYTTATDLLYSLIYNLKPSYLHIISNKIGYDCIIKYNDELRQKTAIIFSSYNYLIDNRGNYVGFHVNELPKAYRFGDTITTDNQKAKQMLMEKFGFLEQDILIHNQLYNLDVSELIHPTNKDGINILWAAHIRPEKNPEILNQIASNLASKNINIDCYGLFDPDNWPDHKNPLNLKLSNLHYCGPYSNFFQDINLSKYDLFLYTSHTDGTPNVILEAAIAGLPIVTSDIGGIHDKLGDYAYYVQNTHSAKMFTNNILNALEHHETSTKNAKLLQKKFLSLHSKQKFNEQIIEMLERNKKDV